MLEISDLHAAYGSARVLHGVSLAAEPGQVTCLLGRNGAGKSTTLKCVMGLLGASAGQIRLDGQDIKGAAPHRVARLGVGYVPEARLVFPDLTVEENLAIGLWRGGRGLKAAMERVLMLFPRLADKRAARGGTLSGGEQQMLSIGRALMPSPRCLLVDEPTEGLAPVVVQALERGLLALAAEGVAVLVVESKLDVARRIADSIHVMGKGRTAFAGSAVALATRPDISREYLEV